MDTQPVLIMVPGDNADTLYSVQPAVRAELDRLRARVAELEAEHDQLRDKLVLREVGIAALRTRVAELEAEQRRAHWNDANDSSSEAPGDDA